MAYRDEIGEPVVSNVARKAATGAYSFNILPAPGSGYRYVGVRIAYDISAVSGQFLVGEDDLTEGTDQIYLDMKQTGHGQVFYDFAPQTASNKQLNGKFTAAGNAWVKVEARKTKTNV